MEETAENRDERAHWLIKNVRVAIRKRALSCAGKRRITMPEWIEEAVANQDRIDAGTMILPPDVRPKPGASPELSDQMRAIERVLTDAAQGAQASGKPMSERLLSQCNAVMDAYLRAERGLLPRKVRSRTIGSKDGKPAVNARQKRINQGKTGESAPVLMDSAQ